VWRVGWGARGEARGGRGGRWFRSRVGTRSALVPGLVRDSFGHWFGHWFRAGGAPGQARGGPTVGGVGGRMLGGWVRTGPGAGQRPDRPVSVIYAVRS